MLDPRALKTTYNWNGLDNQTALASPDTGATTRTFDDAGNVTSSTDARGNKTVYRYDALSRRTKAIFADGTTTVWQYDQGSNGIGRLSKITDVTGSTKFSYDANGHVTQKIQVIGAVTLTTAYGYDAGGRLASITYPSGAQVAYAYDGAGRVSSVTANGQPLATGVTYQPFGMATGWTAGNGASYQRTVDLDGRITGLALPASDTIALAYDAASRITGLTETGLPAQSFGYDALDRLTGYASGPATQTYTYDANGNRAGFTSNDGITPPVSQAYNIDTASNRLLGINGGSDGSFTYDASGNMLSYSTLFAGYSFTYDARNRMAESFVGAIGTPVLINGLGQRVGIVISADPYTFAYDEAGHLTGKYDANSAANNQEIVWVGDLPVAVFASAGTYYVAPDHLGAPHQITDGSANVAWLWDHDPFGNGDPTGSFAYDLRFPGQFYDQANKMHYNYFRDYDPRTGRYIESDSIGLAGGINTYAYVGGNPVNYIDSLGAAPISFYPNPYELAEAEVHKNVDILAARSASAFVVTGNQYTDFTAYDIVTGKRQNFRTESKGYGFSVGVGFAQGWYKRGSDKDPFCYLSGKSSTLNIGYGFGAASFTWINHDLVGQTAGVAWGKGIGITVTEDLTKPAK